MPNFCKTCKHVRTAEELGVVSPVTAADELFCGLHPPQVGSQSVRQPSQPIPGGDIQSLQWDVYDDQPMRLPPCNDGQGYRNMACWTAKDKNQYTALYYTVDQLEALYALMSKAPIEWQLRNAYILTRCQEVLMELRMGLRSRP